MADGERDFCEGPEFLGACIGARMALEAAGLAADPEHCALIATAVLCGFAQAGGLEPAAIASVREAVFDAAQYQRH